MCCRIRFSAFVHLQKAPITARSENMTDSQSSTYRRKYYHIFKQNVVSVHIRKNTHNLILCNHFGKYLEIWKGLTRFVWSEPLQNFGLV